MSISKYLEKSRVHSQYTIISLTGQIQIPWIKEYDGTTDPISHPNVYMNVMNLQVAPNPVMCKAFLQTLTNTARDWFSTLEIPLPHSEIWRTSSRPSLQVVNQENRRIPYATSQRTKMNPYVIS